MFLCTGQRFWARSRCCVTDFRMFPSCKHDTQHLLTSSHFFLPSSWQLPFYSWSLWIWQLLIHSRDAIIQWLPLADHIINLSMLCLQARPCCLQAQDVFPSQGQIMPYCSSAPHSPCPFVCQWVFQLFIPLGYCEWCGYHYKYADISKSLLSILQSINCPYLNAKYPLQTHVFEHFFSCWWRSFGRLENLLDMGLSWQIG